MSKPTLPPSLLEAAAVYELFPSTDNARAFVDELGKVIVRELVSKAVTDLLMAKLDEGPQDGGMVGLIPLPAEFQGEPREISKVRERAAADVCTFCGRPGHVYADCKEAPF